MHADRMPERLKVDDAGILNERVRSVSLLTTLTGHRGIGLAHDSRCGSCLTHYWADGTKSRQLTPSPQPLKLEPQDFMNFTTSFERCQEVHGSCMDAPPKG